MASWLSSYINNKLVGDSLRILTEIKGSLGRLRRIQLWNFHRKSTSRILALQCPESTPPN